MVVVAAQDPKRKRLGSTAYTVLGLLALRDWTTYELAVQMERGLGRMWSAAPSMVYEEPKHLVAHGLATVRRERTGRRPKAVYAITEAGRRALAVWLSRPGAPPALQFEALLKVVFADQGTADDLVATLGSIQDWAEDALTATRRHAQGYLDVQYIDDIPFENRAHIVALSLAFLNDYYHLVADWGAWANNRAASWHDPGAADEDVRLFRSVSSGNTVVTRRLNSTRVHRPSPDAAAVTSRVGGRPGP